MAHLTRTPAGTWKATIRRKGWPTVVKTFRLKRDAEDWARKTEDEMVQGVFIKRSISEHLMMSDAFDRYENEVLSRKKQSTRDCEKRRIKHLKQYFGDYSLAAVSSEVVAKYRDMRLGLGRKNDTMRLELAIISRLISVH